MLLYRIDPLNPHPQKTISEKERYKYMRRKNPRYPLLFKQFIVLYGKKIVQINKLKHEINI